MKNLWTKRNILDYLKHPKGSLDKNYSPIRQKYRKELREFRRKLEKMIEIEDARADEFDLRYKKELQLREAELVRRKEFDIKNGSPF